MVIIVYSIPTFVVVILVIGFFISFQDEDPEGFKAFMRFLAAAFLVVAAAIIGFLGYFDPTIGSYIKYFATLLLKGVFYSCVASVALSVSWLSYRAVRFFITKK